MTKQEFIDDVNSWWELAEVAEDNDYDMIGEIISTEEIAERIKDQASSIGYGDDWENFARWVDGIPFGYEYYEYRYYHDEFEGLSDSDFDIYKDDLCVWMEENDCFDPEVSMAR